jgi:hypothetical protein
VREAHACRDRRSRRDACLRRVLGYACAPRKSYSTFISSITKIRVEFSGMTGGRPAGP